MGLGLGLAEGRGQLRTVALGMFLLLASSGCAGNTPTHEPPCLPPDYVLSPAEVSPGETVTVHAADAKCNPRYGHNAHIQITVTDAAGLEVLSTTAPMDDAGGFTYQFEVPLQMIPGKASVEAYPADVDWCDDTGRNNRLAHPSGLARASCAARTKALTVSP